MSPRHRVTLSKEARSELEALTEKGRIEATLCANISETLTSH